MSNRWPDKIVVGLTGNIATGKSAVMGMAVDRGALTLDADKIVHELLDSNTAVQEAIVKNFGKEITRPDGRIDRGALAKIVFDDQQALRELEKIVHPAVRKELLARITQSTDRIVFIEAIKLFEGGLAAECDQIWVTDCSLEHQIRRLVVCRGMDEEEAAFRINAQPPQKEKVSKADVIIDTGGTMADTVAHFEIAWAKIEMAAPIVSKLKV